MKIIFLAQYATMLPAAYILPYYMIPSRYSPRKTKCILMAGAAAQLAAQLAALLIPCKDVLYLVQTLSWIVLTLVVILLYSRLKVATTLFAVLTCLSFYLPVEMLCGATYVLTHLSWLNIVQRIVSLLGLSWFLLCILRVPLWDSIAEISHGWAFFCLVPILFCIALHLIVQYPYPVYDYPLQILPLLAMMALQYIIYIIMFRFFTSLRENYRKNRDRERMEAYLSGMRSYELSIVNNVSQMAIYRHDLRHLQLALMAYLKDGDTNGAMQALECFSSTIAEPTVLYSKDRLLNSLFNHYISLCQQKNIRIHLQLALPEQFPCEPMDFAITLSNAMENAINACEKLSPERVRELWLRCEKQKNSLFFEVKNTFAGTVVLDQLSGLPVTSLPEHGYGTRSIAIFGKKHNALPDFSVENGIFCLRLLIPYPPESAQSPSGNPLKHP
ncbi:MAG: GHKL domain-containing protein [Ruthenibacterium sp.]